MTDNDATDEPDDDLGAPDGRRVQQPTPAPRLLDQLIPSLRDLGKHIVPTLDTSRWLMNFRPPVNVISPELRDAMRRMHEHWVIPGLDAAVRDIADTLMRASVPPNWFDHDVDLRGGVDCVQEDGLPVAWVPPGAVLHAVAQAPTRDARVAVLLAHQPAVLSDCTARLHEVTTLALRPAADATSAAVDAMTAGHPMPAQALAASVIDTLVTEVFGLPQGPTTLKKAHLLRDDTSLRQLRTALVVTAAEHALKSFNPRRDPTPATFNRHATVHTVDAVQFTGANALIGVLLATSMTREAQALLDAGTIAETA